MWFPLNQAVDESSGEGVYILELVAVLPDYQGFGAGASLVKWGTDAAEKQGLSSVVVGTPVARRLYEKMWYGFRTLGRCGLRLVKALGNLVGGGDRSLLSFRGSRGLKDNDMKNHK